MIGRFLRAYPAYTAEQVLYQVPIQRFWALYHAIPQLEAADDLRALMVAGHGANVGEKGRAFASFAQRLQTEAEGRRAGRQVRRESVTPGLTVGTVAAEPGSLRAARQAKLAELAGQQRPA